MVKKQPALKPWVHYTRKERVNEDQTEKFRPAGATLLFAPLEPPSFCL
jgi:hypothetical protein